MTRQFELGHWRAGLTALLLASTPLGVRAQAPLTLEQALRQADAGAFGNAIARADADAVAAQGLGALEGVLPTVRFEAGWQRTDDPIGVFGIRLRQREITQQDFDPARLNHPGALGNWGGAVQLEQPLLNLDAWLGRSAAVRATAASRAGAAWSATEMSVEVVRAYYGSVLAAEAVETLEASHRAALQHVRRARSMVENGLVTRSDVLLAEVKAGGVETQLVEARGSLPVARRGLALLLGDPESTVAVPESLPRPEAVARLLARDAPDASDAAERARADVRAASLAQDAARRNVLRAKSAFLPRLNGFGRYQWDAPDGVYQGEPMWSVGVMATWTPFAGASQAAEVRSASARERAAAARAAAARGHAGLDMERAATDRRVAHKRLEIALRAAAQAEEAHRIVERKYEGGLADIIELLDAAALETKARLDLSRAVHGGLVAHAEWLRATGAGFTALATLDGEETR